MLVFVDFQYPIDTFGISFRNFFPKDLLNVGKSHKFFQHPFGSGFNKMRVHTNIINIVGNRKMNLKAPSEAFHPFTCQPTPDTRDCLKRKKRRSRKKMHFAVNGF